MKFKCLVLCTFFVFSSLGFAEHLHERTCSTAQVEVDFKDHLDIFTIQEFREINYHLNLLAEKTPREKIHLVFDIDSRSLWN